MKKTIYFLLAVLLCAGLAGCTKAAESDEIALEAGQTLAIGRIDSISGNEMTVSLVNEVETDSAGQGGSSMQRPDGTPGMQMPSGTSAPQSTDGANNGGWGGMPSGTWAPSGNSGNRPSRGQNSGTNPSNTASGNGQPSEGGNVSSTPSLNSGAQGESGEGSQNGESTGENRKVTQYQATGETKTLLIPVNTPVTTQLGAVTTFARLAADDVIKMVMQDDVVMAIYIVG